MTSCPESTIPISKVKALIDKLQEAQRLIEWDYVDDVIGDLKKLLPTEEKSKV